MATECTQDAILHFLTGRGGRATNKDLLEHFKPVLSSSSVPGDPQKRRATVRETFKGFVDNVAFVKTDDNGVKCVCLKKKYRRLIVKENGNVPGTSGAGAAGTEVTVPGQEEVTVPGQEEVTVPGQEEVTVPGQEEDASRCDNVLNVVEIEIMGKQQQQQPCATEKRSECSERTERTERPGEESVTSGEEASHLQQQRQQQAQLSPAGSGYGNDTRARRGETHISPGTILVDNSKEENLHGPQQQHQQQPVAVGVEEEEGVASGGGFDDMGNAMGFNKREKKSGSGGASAERRVRADREPAPDIPQIAIIEASPLPAAADGSMFDLPGHLHQHCGRGHGGGGDVHSGTTPEQGSRRRNSTGSLRSLRSSHPSDDDDESPSRGSLSGSDDNAAPRASRQNFIELMMNSSPQVRRSMALRNSVHLSRCKDSSRSDDSASLASSMADEDRASVALDPLEHAWMMCASDGEWGGLQHLLADEPALLLRRDFVTGFTCLHWAAKHGRPELLALIVNFAKRHGVAVDVDVRSGAGGYTPLHLAAMHGHADVVKLLVGAYDADVEVRDYSGKKACQYLTGNATIDIREIAGASSSGGAGDPDSENAVNGAAGTTAAAGGARRRFSNALLHPHLNPLKLHLHHHHHENDGDADNGTTTDGQRRSKPVRRKSSLGDRMRPKLQRLRDRTSQIVHSVSFHDAEDLRASRSRGSFKSSSSSRPKSSFLG